MLNIPEEVKRALRAGDLRKNYKMKVNDVDPDTGARTYAYTIDNNTIVKESVKIDERMATGKNLKFGLCEGSSLEFQYFDHPNINGKDIQVYISIEYVDENGDLDWYDIPMGWYTVDQCPVQWSTGIYKVTAYNKLKSDYLDKKCNTALIESLDDPNVQVPIIGIRNYFLSNYEVLPVGDIVNHTAAGGGGTGDIFTFKVTGYTDDTPINVYNLNYSNNRDVFIEFYSEVYTFTIDPDKYYQLIEIARTVSGYQTEFVRYMTDMIDNSPVNTTGAAFFANFDSVPNRWKKLSSICITDTDSVESYYSDYPYKNAILGFTGTIEDLTKTIIHNAVSVKIRIPYLFMIYVASYNDPDTYWPEYQTGWFSGNAITYKGEYSIQKTYPALHYPDGEVIPSFSSTNPVYPYESWLNLFEMVNLSPADLVLLDPETVPEFTLRDLVSATYETVAQYGQLDREADLFSGVELNQGGLYPADTLYPANDLYPQGNMLHPFPSSYQKLWTDTIGEQSFRYLIITYKTMENGQEVEKTLQRTVNTYGTTDYNMSDNWLFKNLIWSESDVGDYADAMVLKMKDIRWFPFEMWAAGLPHIETGDAIEITDKNGNTHTSYVLTRTLDGIQNLQDTFINGELDIF